MTTPTVNNINFFPTDVNQTPFEANPRFLIAYTDATLGEAGYTSTDPDYTNIYTFIKEFVEYGLNEYFNSDGENININKLTLVDTDDPPLPKIDTNGAENIKEIMNLTGNLNWKSDAASEAAKAYWTSITTPDPGRYWETAEVDIDPGATTTEMVKFIKIITDQARPCNIFTFKINVTVDNSPGFTDLYDPDKYISFIWDRTGLKTSTRYNGVVKYSNTPEIEWTLQLGTSTEDIFQSMVVDSSGNIYVTGNTAGDIDGNESGTHAGSDDTFLIKYDSNGEFKWSRQQNFTSSDKPRYMAIDSQNNIYITYYEEYNLFGSVYNLAKLLKYDSAGAQLADEQIVGNDANTFYILTPSGIVIDSQDNVYVTGISHSTNFDGNNGSDSGDSIFLVKYTQNSGDDGVTKDTTSLKQHSVSGLSQEANKIAVDNNDNVYITGYAEGDLDGITNPSTSPATKALFVIKYNADGTHGWTRLHSSTGNDVGKDIAIDDSGNIYITGTTDSFWEDGGSNKGGNNAFLICLDPDGEINWKKDIQTEHNEETTGVFVDSNYNVYVCGWTTGNFFGDTIDHNIRDWFVAKYDQYGNELWLDQYGSSTNDEAHDIKIDPSNGAIYVCGSTEGNLGDTYTNQGGKDGFLIKITEDFNNIN